MTAIEKERKLKGYTQQYMADKIDTSVACYNMYENNQRKVPKEKAIEISKVLECSLDVLFEPFSFTVSEINAKEI